MDSSRRTIIHTSRTDSSETPELKQEMWSLYTISEIIVYIQFTLKSINSYFDNIKAVTPIETMKAEKLIDFAYITVFQSNLHLMMDVVNGQNDALSLEYLTKELLDVDDYKGSTDLHFQAYHAALKLLKIFFVLNNVESNEKSWVVACPEFPKNLDSDAFILYSNWVNHAVNCFIHLESINLFPKLDVGFSESDETPSEEQIISSSELRQLMAFRDQLTKEDMEKIFFQIKKELSSYILYNFWKDKFLGNNWKEIKVRLPKTNETKTIRINAHLNELLNIIYNPDDTFSVAKLKKLINKANELIPQYTYSFLIFKYESDPEAVNRLLKLIANIDINKKNKGTNALWLDEKGVKYYYQSLDDNNPPVSLGFIN